MANTEKYRPNVGAVIFNKNADIWIGKRADITSNSSWQMPQGGIDINEPSLEAAVREVYEETGIKSIKQVSFIDKWIKYKLPANIAVNKWNGKYVGQMQKWYLFYFYGNDSEVNINIDKNPEFIDWKWADRIYIEKNVADFRKNIYKNVFKKFSINIINTLN